MPNATEEEAQTPPLYAELGSTNNDYTVVIFDILGRKTATLVDGHAHNTKARTLVKEWNAHFGREWLAIRETSATIMQNFIHALEQQGVEGTAITAALEEIKANVEN